MAYEDLRAEFTNPAFRKKLQNELSSKCACCGCEESIEYHHVVPLFLGGDNRISNIVPLCHRCHVAAHNGRHISKYKNKAISGRKSVCSIEENSDVFDMFINGEIGSRKCCELLGYADNSTPVLRRAEFKRYMKLKGIKTVHNLVDVAFTTRRNGVKDGDVVGEVVYIDGTKRDMIFKDTGHNNIEYKRRA